MEKLSMLCWKPKTKKICNFLHFSLTTWEKLRIADFYKSFMFLWESSLYWNKLINIKIMHKSSAFKCWLWTLLHKMANFMTLMTLHCSFSVSMWTILRQVSFLMTTEAFSIGWFMCAIPSNVPKFPALIASSSCRHRHFHQLLFSD